MTHTRVLPPVVACLAVLWLAAPVPAATLRHSDLPDFSGGISDGLAVPMIETNSPASGPKSGGVGLMPGLGASRLNEDFNYADMNAARAGGWRFLLPNAQPEQPSSISFVGGAARMRVSTPQDLLEPGSKNSPVLLAYNQPITGDFIVETKLSYPDGRVNERSAGIFITDFTGNAEEPVAINDDTRYVYAAVHRLDVLNSVAALHPGAVVNYSGSSFPGDAWWVRVVKRGGYFYSFFKSAENSPWIFNQWAKVPDLENKPLIVAAMGKSFVAPAPETMFQNIDFDYLRVNAVGTLTGVFTNLMDGGPGANWQTVSMDTLSMEGVKYQLRTGNTKAAGTLTDAGSFAGPDGTANTWFEDDVAQVVPNGLNKRYLEYKLALDQTAANLPAFLRSFSAVVQPLGVGARLISDGPEFGADTGNLEVQPGGGDLSLRRTPVFVDNFDSSTLEPGWDFNPGMAFYDPNAVGDYSLSARPGYLRLIVGYPQNFDVGGEELGGVRLLRPIPLEGGLPLSDFEIETEVTMEVQQSRQAVLWMYQDNDNNVGISVIRRNATTWEVGLLEQLVMNDGTPGRVQMRYGSNTMQMRVTKRGQIVTMAVRDAASPSPSWRVVSVRNWAGAATGKTDFTPTQVGLLAKSFGQADRGIVNEDFNYFKISKLSDSGTREVVVNTPAGARLDKVLALGDALSTDNTRFQISNGGGFVGPDGTGATYFTANEPKVPSSLVSAVSPQVRIVLDNTTPGGSPYLHSMGLQYLTGDVRVARDTNRQDFAAGGGTNVDVATTPGVVLNGGVVVPGTPQVDEFNYNTNDLDQIPWSWQNPANPSGQSDYSFTANPGHLRLLINQKEDIGTGAHYHVFMYRDGPTTGDWEIETTVKFPQGRENGRITGVGVYTSQNNMLLFGALNTNQVAVRSYNNSGSIVRDTPSSTEYVGGAVHLRLRKEGQLYTAWARADDDFAEWNQIISRPYPGMVDPKVGVMAMSSNAQTAGWPAEYDSFTYTPFVTDGTFLSRALDLGATGLTPSLTVSGTNVNLIRFQFRAADTEAGLASQPYTGPDGTVDSYYTGDFTGPLATNLTGKRFYQYRAIMPGGAALNEVELIGLTVAPPSRAQAIQALRVAGGLDALSSGDLSRLDVVGGASAGRVDIVDALQLLRDAVQ